MRMSAVIVLLLYLHLPLMYAGLSAKDVNDVRNAIRFMLMSDGPGHPIMAGCVRLGFHDCIGGCDGCVDVENPNNAGLKGYIDQLEQIERGDMSRADLWALCVVESIVLGALMTPPKTANAPQAMPNITFRAGRPHPPAVCPERVFPDETKSPIPYLLDNFPGLQNSTELAYALMGAHTFGRAHIHHSGHINPWTTFPDWADNEYYRVLLEMDEVLNWRQMPLIRIRDFEYIYQWAPAAKALMMLHVDCHLVLDLSFINGTTQATCGFPNTGMPACPEAADAGIAHMYAEDNILWMADFSKAVQAMIDNGNEDVLYTV